MKITLATVAAVIVCLFPGVVRAAEAPPATKQLEAIARLDWLLGTWKGGGWIEFTPGERRIFKQTEVVERKAGGMVITIEGHGTTDQGGTNSTVLDAFTVVSYNPREQKYRWHSHTDKGYVTDVEIKVGEKTFQWSLETPGFGTMRYTMVLNEKGEWAEIGEMSRDKASWRKFFEMTLRKNPEANR
jgi:hypothetical protein